MAIDWMKLLQSGLNIGSQLLPGASGGNTGTTNPLLGQLAGAGLLGAGVLSDKEPGEVTQARQYLRNQFTSPNATSDLQRQAVTGAQTALNPLLGNVGPTGPGQQYLTDMFQNPNGLATNIANNVSAVSQQFQPLLTQQRQRGIDDISQRFAAAFPSSVGAQGSEFGSLSRYITDEALPREQAFLGQLGLDLQGRQQNAAGTVYQDEQNRRQQIQSMATQGMEIPINAAGKILDTSKPDQMSQLMTMLGYDMLTRNGQGGSTLLGQNGQPIGQVGSNGQVTPGTGGVAGVAGALGGLTDLQRLLNGGQIGPHGEIIGGTGSPVGAGGAAGGIDFGVAGPGLLGPAGTGSGMALASAAGSAVGGGAVGYQVGKSIGDAVESPNSSMTGLKTGAAGGAGGAVSGAAVGFAVGGPVGAVIGGIVGGIAGIFSGSGAERRREDAQTEQEIQQTASERPALVQNAQQLTQSSSQFLPQVQQTIANRQLVASVGQLAAQDTQVSQFLQKAQARLAPIAQGEAPIDFSPNKEGVDNFLNLVRLATARGNINLSAPGVLASGSESLSGLIQSGEIGKFGVGQTMIQRYMNDFNDSVGLYTEFMNLVRQKMGG